MIECLFRFSKVFIINFRWIHASHKCDFLAKAFDADDLQTISCRTSYNVEEPDYWLGHWRTNAAYHIWKALTKHKDTRATDNDDLSLKYVWPKWPNSDLMWLGKTNQTCPRWHMDPSVFTVDAICGAQKNLQDRRSRKRTTNQLTKTWLKKAYRLLPAGCWMVQFCAHWSDDSRASHGHILLEKNAGGFF